MSKFLLAVFCIVALFAAVYAQEPIKLTSGQWTQPYNVQPRTFQMFYIEIEDNHQETREIVIKMQESGTVTGFDPDLYVRFDSPPSFNEFDKRDTSVAKEHVITLEASTKFPMPLNRKLYIGVYAYSTVGGSFTVMAQTHNCAYSDCGGTSRGLCIPDDGDCKCQEGFQTHIGCTAEDRVLPLQETFSTTLLNGQTAYFNVTLPPAQAKAWFQATLTRTSADQTGTAVMFIKKGALPTSTSNVGRQFIYNGYTSAALTLGDNLYSAGVWTIGVVNNAQTAFSFSISTSVEFCKNNCSKHGTCNKDTSVCTCDPHYNISPEDCSIRSFTLTMGESQLINPEPNSRTFFTIPVSQPIADAPLELGIHLELKSTEIAQNIPWPVMYVTREGTPSPSKHDFTSHRPALYNQTLYIPDSHVTAGNLHLLVVNPNALDYQYELKLVPRPHCPTGCHINGNCTPLAECHCHSGFAGGSCELSQADCDKIRGITIGTSYKVVVAIFFIAAALAAGIAAFVYAKFFYVAPQSQQPTEMQYDPLSA